MSGVNYGTIQRTRVSKLASFEDEVVGVECLNLTFILKFSVVFVDIIVGTCNFHLAFETMLVVCKAVLMIPLHDLFLTILQFKVCLTIQVFRLNIGCTLILRRVQNQKVGRDIFVIVYSNNVAAMNLRPLLFLPVFRAVVEDIDLGIVFISVIDMSLVVLVTILEH